MCCLPVAEPLQLVLERVLTKAAQGTEDSQEYASVLHLLHHACHLRVRLHRTVLLCIPVLTTHDTLLQPALPPVRMRRSSCSPLPEDQTAGIVAEGLAAMLPCVPRSGCGAALSASSCVAALHDAPFTQVLPASASCVTMRAFWRASSTCPAIAVCQ